MQPRILIVDDSNTTLLMEELLFKQRTKYEIIKARDGKEAISKALSEKPDVILLDIIMPQMDGFEACRQMRKHKALKTVPIILVTSRGEPCNVETGFECGCNDYLTKPINPSELIELVEGYLSARKNN